MGKSSTLKQLPDLLGARYLPVFFDLQSRAASSSIVNFLGAISTAIYNVMISRGLQVKKLGYERLVEASMTNEIEVYYVFEKWLADVERVLAREDRTLLLTFDEFEKLKEVRQGNYFDLRLLLDWFRSVIQNHPFLALLFSGIQTLSEMSIGTDINWAGYFVNVQTLKVGFLKPLEARQLITQPISNFPAKQVFGDGVVEEIMRVTGCHPFLVQAICSKLIDDLNAENRERAEIWNVENAVNQMLESWDTYFMDLWERTDPNQQACLFTIKRLGQGDLQEVTMQSGLDETIVRKNLQTLQRRDLLLLESGTYRIAAPIFAAWIEHNL
jgi:hypothetical protein